MITIECHSRFHYFVVKLNHYMITETYNSTWTNIEEDNPYTVYRACICIYCKQIIWNYCKWRACSRILLEVWLYKHVPTFVYVWSTSTTITGKSGWNVESALECVPALIGPKYIRRISRQLYFIVMSSGCHPVNRNQIIIILDAKLYLCYSYTNSFYTTK